MSRARGRTRTALASRPPVDFSAADAALAAAVSTGRVPGLVAAVTDRGGVVYRRAIGLAAAAAAAPMCIDTVFRIASALHRRRGGVFVHGPNETHGELPHAGGGLYAFLDGTQKFGFNVMIETEARATGRPAGTYGWAGVFNTYYWVDAAAGFAACCSCRSAPSATPGASRPTCRSSRRSTRGSAVRPRGRVRAQCRLRHSESSPKASAVAVPYRRWTPRRCAAADRAPALLPLPRIMPSTERPPSALKACSNAP